MVLFIVYLIWSTTLTWWHGETSAPDRGEDKRGEREGSVETNRVNSLETEITYLSETVAQELKVPVERHQ